MQIMQVFSGTKGSFNTMADPSTNPIIVESLWEDEFPDIPKNPQLRLVLQVSVLAGWRRPSCGQAWSANISP